MKPLTPIRFRRYSFGVQTNVISYGDSVYVTDCGRFVILDFGEGRNRCWLIVNNHEHPHADAWNQWTRTTGIEDAEFSTRTDAIKALAEVLIDDDALNTAQPPVSA